MKTEDSVAAGEIMITDTVWNPAEQEDAIAAIMTAMNVKREEIIDITVLKKGMTNRSFLFCCKGEAYIMRVPGEGTEQLINREEEYAVYQTLEGKGICDRVIYIDPKNGFKITRFYENTRVCDPLDPEDVRKCMKKLREFHERRLVVPHTFDLFGLIQHYEELWDGRPSAYADYAETKERVFSLRAYIESHVEERILTHIDAVPDNFLIFPNDQGGESIRLIDWEYAGMQDPHMDVAMFCIYALYDREHIEALIDAYFTEGCRPEIRIKIYCYIAACGLLWSNWCEYKRIFGLEFGDYTLGQYRYARDYYSIAMEEMERIG